MNTEIQTQPTDESEKHLNLLVRFNKRAVVQ